MVRSFSFNFRVQYFLMKHPGTGKVFYFTGRIILTLSELCQ